MARVNKKTIVATKDAPEAIGPYSQAVIHGGIAYLSGQIPLHPATQQLVQGDIALQTERVLENIKGVLTACGSSFDRVLKTTVFLADMGEFARMNEVYGRYFTKEPPARSTVQAASLPRGVAVEIDCIAIAGDQPA
jgi:2-iminobutanoate/2-iminopropanoate deaminase